MNPVIYQHTGKMPRQILQERQKTQLNQKLQEECILMMQATASFPKHFWNFKHNTLPKEIRTTGNRIPVNKQRCQLLTFSSCTHSAQ